MTHDKASKGGPRDLPNRDLIAIVAFSLLGGLALAVLAPALPGDWGRAGGPLLQGAAALGAVLLLASFRAVFGKRFGKPGKNGFRGHVWLASIGTALVFAHAAGNLGRPPALLLAALALLIGLGVWSRIDGARRSGAVFGQKRPVIAPPDPDRRARLKRIIAEKQALLARIEPGADEGLFSLSPRHWLAHPAASARYARLAAREERETGARAALSPTHARWRLGHRLIAWGFVAGLILHILIVTFLAGYAADGGDVYWLHLAAWDF